MSPTTTQRKETELGQIPQEWEVLRLGDLFSTISDTYKFTNKEVYFLNTGDIERGKLINAQLFDPNVLPGQAKKSIKKGDVLYSEIRPANGRYMLVDFEAENFVVSTKLMVLRNQNESKYDTKFLYYVITSPTYIQDFQILAESRSGTFPQITFDAIQSYDVALPPLPEQRSIASILGSLDDKIELLREQNKTLEKIGQTIFKSRFVDFDGQTEFEESELGRIPKGRRVGKLGEEFEIIMGQSPDGKSYNESGEGIIFFQGRAEFQERFPKIRLYTTKPTRIAEKNDTLVSVRAPVGDINIAIEKCCIGRGLSAIRSKYKSYCFYKMQSLKAIFDQFNGEGTIFGSINKDAFMNINTIIPIGEWIQEFDEKVKLIDEKVLINDTKIQSLTQLRDALLPRLMSGRVRVILM